ncbi:activating signal cointegrator 1 [Stomoxys calcitrans]|uniref:activating signal cointegrator 1 n=1 Tax=Stomoxys calcitrans TaxID=35570 RepID=UPI0027E2CE6B|nr:activating signal cointegrator 1 [Stomoxys calcitrans]
MEKWLRDRLSNCLDFEVPDDMIKYILSMKTSNEFDEYFESLLNKDCEDHRTFLTDCKQRLFSKALANKKQNQQQQAKKVPSPGLTEIKQNKSSSPNNSKLDAGSGGQNQHSQAQGAKKKTKYVNLYTNDGKVIGDTIMLKGRRFCDCQAAQHKLVNNCLSCGRIVCEQEGSGPCLFCGNIVCTNEEQHVLKSAGKKGETLMKTLKEKGGGESLKKALEQRDRLLEYDRNSEKRTTVIDDELDYFEENSVWHSDEQRAVFEKLKQEMHDRKHASRINRKIKIDFAGREVDEDVTISSEYEKAVLKEVATINAKSDNANNWSNRKHTQKTYDDNGDVDPNMDGIRPLYRPSAEERARNKASSVVNDGLERVYNRVQDKELLEMQDLRQCLSMHQPWASLLVAGIKKHEGRVWYTEHRGRLWIASTAKEPRPEEIKEMEDFYKVYYNDPTIRFPEHYPTGCLLGCVKVDECLPQEEYQEVYPNGESDSPYVFICSNPEQLPVVFPIKGQHKIYQIDPKIHNAACKTLLRMKVNKG